MNGFGNSIFQKGQGNAASANGGRTPISMSKTKLTPRSVSNYKVSTPKSTPIKDENTKPLFTPKCETPLSHHNRINRGKHGNSGKKVNSEPIKTDKTPFTTYNSKSVNSPSSQKTVTTYSSVHTTPGKRDKFLVEFNDDILITPKHLFTDNGGATVSVTSTSTVCIETPMSRKKGASPFSSPLNRSLSTSSIVRSSKSESASSNLKRCQSEAQLSVDTSPNSEASTNPGCKEGESSRVTVGVRVRPLHQREHGNAVFVKGREVRIASDMGAVHRFTYDNCFPSSGPEAASQEQVYETLVKPLVDNAFDGYNASLFAYGQTGSGKTYSMMGSLEGQMTITEETGIIPRFCKELISRISALDENGSGDTNKPTVTSNIEISYLEVYNEKIHDLLVPGSNALKVREHPVFGPYVVDLTKKSIASFSEFQHWLDVGNKKRATAATEMNDKSSRSHSIFTVILTQTFVQVGEGGNWSHDHTRRSQINLVDLAGSERIAHTSVSSDRLREGVSINRSLLTLGKVITALVDKRSFVPYRESVLTWLLKDSLGGNSRTTMLATISPCSSHIEESLATLRYASQARSIVNTVRINEAPQDKIIRELKAEVERLKEIQNEFERSQSIIVTPQHDNELKSIESKLLKTKEELEHSKKLLEETSKQLNDCAVLIKNHETEKLELAEKIKILDTEKGEIENKAKEYLDNYTTLAEKVESEKLEKRLFLSSAEDEMRKLLNDYNTLKNECDLVKEERKQAVQLVETQKSEKDVLITKYTELEEKLKNADEAAASLKSKLKVVESELEQLHDINNQLVNEQTDMMDRLKTCIENNEALTLKCEALENKNKLLEDDKIKVLDEHTALINELTILKADHAHVISELKSKNSEISQLRSELEKFKGKLIMTNQLETEVKNMKHTNSKLQKQLKNVEVELESLHEKNDKLHLERDNLDCKLQEYSKISNDLLAKLEFEVVEKQTLNEEIKKMADEHADLKLELDTLKSINSQHVDVLENGIAENNKLKSEYELLKEKFETASLLEGEVSNLKQSSSSLKKQLKKIENELISAQEKNAKITAENSKLQKELEKTIEKNSQLSSDLDAKKVEKKALEEKVNLTTDECKLLAHELNVLKKSLTKLETDLEAKENEIKRLKISDKATECELIKNLEASQEIMQSQIRILEKKLLNEESEKLKFEKERDEAYLKLKGNEDICDNLQKDLEIMTAQISSLEAQLKTSQHTQQVVMEEKLTLAKAMEKQCLDGSSSQDYKTALSENAKLKRDLNINGQRLQKKVKKIEMLNERVCKLEDIMKLILEEKISFKNQKELLEKALIKKDVDAYEFLMNISFPHHLQHLTRKARHFAELYRIPYDFKILENSSVEIKHLLLSAKATLHHGQFHDWVDKVEKESSWQKNFDVDIPWEVDFGDYYERENDVPKTLLDIEESVEADRALRLGTKKTRHGFLDPIEWRRMLVKRHVQGIKEDSDVLMKYFPDSEDSRVYSILSRIQASVIRLQEITRNVIK
ncbi:kinesin-like protein K39 [Cimex lectularius]|uniref:Kinesin motor domain-containing protein n=1 Tax=Cimex lectularius TaxID=79782 RepID=A0A8I6S9R8_CIMLE|nr:kinesin-like protein K39 [Cimex lectularius]